MSQAYVATLKHQVQKDHPGAAAEEKQSVARNRALGSGKVDSGGVAQNLQFPFRSKGMATQGEKYVEAKFANPPHPKDGYFLPECKDSRARRMLEFIISIFYP